MAMINFHFSQNIIIIRHLSSLNNYVFVISKKKAIISFYVRGYMEKCAHKIGSSLDLY